MSSPRFKKFLENPQAGLWNLILSEFRLTEHMNTMTILDWSPANMDNCCVYLVIGNKSLFNNLFLSMLMNEPPTLKREART